ncbi:hypothetical protein A2U01_0103488, partial [Trifolium medium]|nr:hypothetical protein [Trifolium medium]
MSFSDQVVPPLLPLPLPCRLTTLSDTTTALSPSHRIVVSSPPLSVRYGGVLTVSSFCRRHYASF